MIVTMSASPPTLDLLRMATTCIERVFRAMLRKAREGAGVSGWHVGNMAMHDRQSPTPLLLDCHGHVVDGDFNAEFNESLQCFVSSLRSWLIGHASRVVSPAADGASDGDRAISSCGASSATAASSITLLSRLVPSWNITVAPTVTGPPATFDDAGMPQGDAEDAAPPVLSFAPLTAETWQPVVDALEAALLTVRHPQQRE